MSKTRGEGRAPSEKTQGVVTPYPVRKAGKEKRLKEEAEWASRSGEVTTRKKEVTSDEGSVISGTTPSSEGSS